MRREKIAVYLTCPICKDLLRDATTISECLHTFCRKCILEKITEESDCCPVCNTNLGCAPLDKLRADHSLQDLRAKIFPSKKSKAKPVEAAPSVPLATVRKERSLSSLVVNTPRIPAHTAATGKITRTGKRKVLGSRELTFPVYEPFEPVADHAGCSSPPETINNIAQNKAKESNDTLEVHEYENGPPPVLDSLVKPRNLKGVRQKRAALAKKLNSQAQAMVDVSSECEQGVSSTWFSPVASSQQKGVTPLPQVPSRYLRIKSHRKRHPMKLVHSITSLLAEAHQQSLVTANNLYRAEQDARNANQLKENAIEQYNSVSGKLQAAEAQASNWKIEAVATRRLLEKEREAHKATQENRDQLLAEVDHLLAKVRQLKEDHGRELKEAHNRGYSAALEEIADEILAVEKEDMKKGWCLALKAAGFPPEHELFSREMPSGDEEDHARELKEAVLDKIADGMLSVEKETMKKGWCLALKAAGFFPEHELFSQEIPSDDEEDGEDEVGSEGEGQTHHPL